MHVITARNVNDAYARAIVHMAHNGRTVMTRNGTAMVCDEPVTTHYANPRERVLWDEARDANPTFHLVEALWMLTGRDDTPLMSYLVPRMLNFAEKSKGDSYFHGAYGMRWRNMTLSGDHEIDQLDEIVKLLQNNAVDRRIVLQMWDARLDLGAVKNDIPCNVIAKFMVDPVSPQRLLNMVVFNRSNDIILGCYGANAVHFSVLHEYIAARAGFTVGWYEQVSCDWHAYTAAWEKTVNTGMLPLTPYDDGSVSTTPIVDDPLTFDRECDEVIAILTSRRRINPGECKGFTNKIFATVVSPMMDAYAMYREGDLATAIECIETAMMLRPQCDWLVAMREWLHRRVIRQVKKLAPPTEG